MHLSSTLQCGTTFPILVVVSLNGAGPLDPQGNKPGHYTPATRAFDKMAEALGCYGEYVEQPNEIRPALNRAPTGGRSRSSVALVNA